jgi:hypothetical protein
MAVTFGIEVKVPDVPLFVPERSRKILNTLIYNTSRLALAEVSGRVSEEAGRFADTGHLAQSFTADPATQTGGIELTSADNADTREGILGRVFSSLPYAIVMDQGRQPGQPISRAGIDAIGLWAQRKLKLSAEQADRAKWAIAFKVASKGIAGQHYFETGVRLANPKVEQLFSILADTMARALVGYQGGAASSGGGRGAA